MNELHLFAGAGGGILGGMLLGHTCVCAVELEPYCRDVLLQRQRDGILPRFPIWDDVRTFDGRPWRDRVDVVCGGFPCQDISVAGKGAGITGERSGLWSEMARIIGEVRPRFAFVENSPMLAVRGLGVVLGDLAAMGYDARWGVLGTRDAGGYCKAERLWLLAASYGFNGISGLGDIALRQKQIFQASHRNRHVCGLQAPSRTTRGADGMADYVERVRAIGNGQVPAVAALAWRISAAPLDAGPGIE